MAVVVFASGIAVLLLRPYLTVRRHPRQYCKNNLRQIGLAIHMYADDYAEAFPPDFKALYPKYVDNPKVFKCPYGCATWQDYLPGGTVTEKSTDYAYVPGFAAEAPGSVVVAYDRNEEDRDGRRGRNVLFADAHVEWWPADAPADFWKYLAEEMLIVARARAEGATKPDFARLEKLSGTK